ncbi:MAG: SLC13 family permease [Gemmatimonadota bacterium]|nr:SLC13 family permease [Gemmatimonadota bacterium]
MSRRFGLVAGFLALAVMLAAPAPAGLDGAAWRTAAVAVLMAVFWLTEAIPIPATSLIPLVAFPLVGAGSIGEAAAPYANPVIFLFMGGFLLALAMERWALHRRLALGMLRRVGSRPSSVIGGLMIVTAFLSMWVSNTAVSLMMLPIGLSVIELVNASAEADGGADTAARSAFAVAVMLGIAYAANVGGMGTLIGTAPNALLAGYMAEAHGVQIGFVEWMAVGVPLVALALPLIYLILTRVGARLGRKDIPGVAELIGERMAALGPISRPERRVAVVFAIAAACWILRPLLTVRVPGLSDAGIAIGCGLLLFLTPSGADDGALLDWETAETLPWGILILFGGGLSLASAIDRTGLNTWLGSSAAGFGDWPPIAFIFLITLLVVLLTELTSNTATTAAFLPVLGAVAVEIGWDPLLVAVPATLAASCAFMLPIATPPNAVAYSSGVLTIPQMARAGIWANAALAFLITALAAWLLPLVLG